jgi:hypothetical protein
MHDYTKNVFKKSKSELKTQNPTIHNCAPRRERFVILSAKVPPGATWD